MKFTYLLAILFTSIFFSCSNDTDDPVIVSDAVINTWKLISIKNFSDQEVATPCDLQYSQIQFKADNSLLYHDGIMVLGLGCINSVPYGGTWSFSGNDKITVSDGSYLLIYQYYFQDHLLVLKNIEVNSNPIEEVNQKVYYYSKI